MAEKIRLTHRKLQVATWDYKREPASSHPAGRCHQRLLAGLNFRFANALATSSACSMKIFDDGSDEALGARQCVPDPHLPGCRVGEKLDVVHALAPIIMAAGIKGE
jgi:hypothetical protein